ncbi:hypothetical protein BO94DRAFT_544105 [Aspergillus sclerotioniger CBS 115572]|uniref:DUF6594 domain-containing protein n=1 Tax=Aspergillus sclerotioniger CBS 115572 TaxID=1450535 RepID=A0A317X3B9_9EURO|nr:hypothetical protein BO94DRAFT_544105 [Aspergillus sclerotioniger CBS 115572]PWY93056.1 hypothetical protein BO94DRAFT_544105 [Aspergillus sclerotioniger CBS 115572]
MSHPELDGYDKVASAMALEFGSAIFRRFTKLNLTYLLYLQGELTYIERDLKAIIKESKKSECPEKWSYFFSVAAMKNSEYSAQWEKVLEGRRLLREYNSTLLQLSQMTQFNKPPKTDLEIFREFLDREEHAKGTMIDPIDQWGEDNEDGLICVGSPHDTSDRFTRWVNTTFVSWFHDRWGVRDSQRQDLEAGLYIYNHQRIKSHTYLISLIILGLLPATSMIVLYFLTNTAAKLVTIFVYNMLFVMVMGLMSKAGRVEIFAAATAFASVQVAMITTGNLKS